MCCFWLSTILVEYKLATMGLSAWILEHCLIVLLTSEQGSAVQLRQRAVPYKQHRTIIKNSDAAGDVAHAEFRRFQAAALNASNFSKAGRPSCAADLPAHSPYWDGQDHYGMTHHKCKDAGTPAAQGIPSAKYPCPRITNRARVDALRKLLKVTHTLMVNLNIDYMLYGGSAIGQYRCRDVLPWDADNDILVSRNDIYRIHKEIYGRPWRDLRANETEYGEYGWGYSEYSADLSKWGLPSGYKLMKKSNCIIYEIVDVNSGFYTDIFPVDYHDGQGFVPWPDNSLSSCSTWTKCASTCYAYPDAIYWPFIDCEMAGMSMRCAKNQGDFIVRTYDAAALTTPDVYVDTF